MCCFSFPADEALRQQWTVKVRRIDHRGRLWSPTKCSVMCSQHFPEDAFLYQFGRKTIKPGALPTIFSFAPEVPKRKVPKCRTGPTGPSTSSCTAETISVAEHSDQSKPGSNVDQSAQLSAPAFFSENSGGAKRVKTFHAYCAKSPTKLRKENEILRRKLALKVGALRNARKRGPDSKEKWQICWRTCARIAC